MGAEQSLETAAARKIEPRTSHLRRKSLAISRVMSAKQLNELFRNDPLFSWLQHERIHRQTDFRALDHN